MKRLSTFIFVMFLFSVLIGYCAADSINSKQQTTSGQNAIEQPSNTAPTEPVAFETENGAITVPPAVTTPSMQTTTPILQPQDQKIEPIAPEILMPFIDKLVRNGYLITINVETNRMTVFKDLKKVCSFPVATGKIVNGKSLTPVGKFVILNKIKEPGWGGGGHAKAIRGGDPKNPLGHFWTGISAGKRPGYSIGIHGNIDEASIGTNASLGCIRMHNYEAPTFFNDIAQIGIPCWINTTKGLVDWGVVGFE